jgi:hypothetical protein
MSAVPEYAALRREVEDVATEIFALRFQVAIMTLRAAGEHDAADRLVRHVAEGRHRLRQVKSSIDSKAASAAHPLTREIETARAVSEIEGTLPHDAWWPTWIAQQERRGRLTAEQARNLHTQHRNALAAKRQRLADLGRELDR